MHGRLTSRRRIHCRSIQGLHPAIVIMNRSCMTDDQWSQLHGLHVVIPFALYSMSLMNWLINTSVYSADDPGTPQAPVSFFICSKIDALAVRRLYTLVVCSVTPPTANLSIGRKYAGYK